MDKVPSGKWEKSNSRKFIYFKYDRFRLDYNSTKYYKFEIKADELAINNEAVIKSKFK